jgi:hypothetical protein
MDLGRKQNINNLQTEKKGIDILLEANNGFFVPHKNEKIFLYDLCGIDYTKYSRSVDCIQLKVRSFQKIKCPEDFFFIEVKTTRDKKVKQLPYGVFFGITENEEELFKRISNYRLCIVHTSIDQYYCMNYHEYSALIKTKRTQYQINFRPK